MGVALQKLPAETAARRPRDNAGEWRRRAAGAAVSEDIAIAYVDRVCGSYVQHINLGVAARRTAEKGGFVAKIAILSQVVAPEGAVVGAAPKSRRDRIGHPRSGWRRRDEQSDPVGHRRRQHCAGRRALPFLGAGKSIRTQGHCRNRYRCHSPAPCPGDGIWRRDVNGGLFATQDACIVQRKQKGFSVPSWTEASTAAAKY